MDEHEKIVNELFLRAVELSPDERAQFLTRSAPEDARVRRDVERLLELDSSGAASRAERELEGEFQDLLDDVPFDHVGDYTLVKTLGRGGMGTVYEAAQQNPRRTVALKLVRRELVTPAILHRFQREGDVLGRLHHPGIAQIYEAGIAEVGAPGSSAVLQPFFAMELVRGLPLCEHAERSRLRTRERLALLASVCDAVQHAHEMGVIHRDLKPANILVDSSGQPKVLDFGVARCTDGGSGSTSFETLPGQLIGTLPYMSPEQVSGAAHAIDTRSDVYALGVILYELLSGRLPIDTRDRPLPDAARAILHDEPARLSTLDTAHRGDVDTIVRCAMEKDRARRYRSASELAADIRRFLNREPITARPATTTYLLRKFAARHPGLVAGAVATVLALTTGTVVASILAVRARSAEQLLSQELVSVKQLSDLQDLEDLTSEADLLWPAWPGRIDEYHDWRRRAGELVERLRLHRASLSDLRADALPRTPAESLAERRRHPEFAHVRELQLEIAALERALARRRDGVASELPTLASIDQPRDVESWYRMGWVLNPHAPGGAGPEGLALIASRRAVELAPPERKAEFGSAVANACFALGLDEEALAASEAVIATAGGEHRAGARRELAALQARVEHANSSEGLAEAAAAIDRLAGQLRELEARVGARRDWRFAAERGQARWWNGQLTKLIDGLEAFANEETGLLEWGTSPEHGWALERRLAEALLLRDRFAPGGACAERWEVAAAGIESTYPGLALEPQMGLVPLGQDPRTGLWEFWHVQSGEEPLRDEDGELVLKPESGLVLVLLQGGTFWMGAHWIPGSPGYEPGAVGNEVPVRAVELSPFFLSKYEMTQGQWERAAGSNPSEWQAGARGPGPYTSLHPVDQVSWNECSTTLFRLGLELPTEAQWEYGCRAGTEGAYSWPLDAHPAAFANLMDAAYQRGFSTTQQVEEWDDHVAATAPVGSYLANAFGVHDAHGNVYEYCRDGLDHLYYAKSRRRDPVAPGFPGEPRVIRGGSYDGSLAAARSAARAGCTPNSININRGVRPARSVE